MRKIATALACVLALITLTACPGRNPAPAPEPSSATATPFPSASYLGSPPVLAPGVVGAMIVDNALPCPPGAQWRIIGFVEDPDGTQLARPFEMKVNQFDRNGDPGTIRDERGVEVPGAGYTRTGISPMSYCAIVNPGDVVAITVSFKIQTNAVGYRVACLAWAVSSAGLRSLVDHDEDEIEPGGLQSAIATCDVIGTAP